MVDFNRKALPAEFDLKALADRVETAFRAHSAKKHEVLERIVREAHEGASEAAIEFAVDTVSSEIFRRMGERAAESHRENIRTGMTRRGQPMIIGVIHRHSGKDAAAGAECEDRREAI